MRFDIILAPEAIQDLERLRAHERAAVRDALERHLRYEPTRTSRSGIKHLRGLSRPQFRLRVGNIRVVYDVAGNRVEVLGVVEKSSAADWLRDLGD